MPPSPAQKEPVGPIIGIVIILLLVLTGAVYFWNIREVRVSATLPYIPGQESTTSVQ